ncbi:MAG: hypothetical protein PHG20_08845 [Geobacteraceae bacterium]|nr:hypothetical protein [Geobacteraceae bacterium]
MKKNTLLSAKDRSDIQKRCHVRFAENPDLRKEFKTEKDYSNYILGAWEGLFPSCAPEKTKKKFRRLSYQEQKDLTELSYLLFEKHESVRKEFMTKEVFAAFKKAEAAGIIWA